MPWKEATSMSLRMEFVEQAQMEGVNFSQLCRQFGISRKTGYKWLDRYQQDGESGLADRSRRPHHSPRRTSAEKTAAILTLRAAHPAWGGRKLKARLEKVDQQRFPAPSTITEILRRHDQIDPQTAQKHRPFHRFEMAAPNQLWQMDFKGHFPIQPGRCHPLTVLDDHSRFLLGLRACPNETQETVQQQLTDLFRCYGLPERILADNGSPWGDDRDHPYTVLAAWLLRLGIVLCHGRPYHPQTQGKDERLHRSLDDELLNQRLQAPPWGTLADWQRCFDQWRQMYNWERPHEALGMALPAERYASSPRPFPEVLPPIEYPSGDLIRKVDESGKIYFHARRFRIGRAFRYAPVALRPTGVDGEWAVFFCHQKVAQISLREDNG